MIKAYILSRCNNPAAIPSATEFLTKVRKVKGVKQAHIVMGPHDGIGYVEVEDLEQLGETISALYEIEGIDKLDTRIAWPR